MDNFWEVLYWFGPAAWALISFAVALLFGAVCRWGRVGRTLDE